MRILMIGDVIGKPGRQAIKTLLPGVRQEYGIDMVIANGAAELYVTPVGRSERLG